MAKLVTLENGVKLFFQKSKSKAFALGVFVGAGCFYEEPEINGIAHFIEHMVFKGTERRSAYDIAYETERHGIMINAYTTRAFTAFYTIGLAEYAEECADILSDMLLHPTFTEENLAMEKNVVFEEINMCEDDGEDLCLENLIKAHYGKKMLSSPILGTKKTVGSLTEPDLRRFMHKLYRPENICVSLVGDVDINYAITLAEKYFTFEKREDAFKLPTVKKAAPKCGYNKTIKPIEQSCVGIALPSFSAKHKLGYAPSILSSVLGGGMSSRLFQEVREKSGLVYEIYTANNKYDTNGHFVIYFATAPERVAEALKKIRAVLDEVVAGGITQEEFDKAFASFKTSLALAGESASEIMRLGGKGALSGKRVTHASMLKEVEKLSLQDVLDAIPQVLDLSKASLSYVGKDLEYNLLQLFKEGINA